DDRVALRTAEVLSAYRGPVATMSFDPAMIAAARRAAKALPRGLVAMQRDKDAPARAVSRFRYVREMLAARPEFLAYRVRDLTTWPPRTAHRLLRWPLLTWTVRTPEQRGMAAQHADQMIFEGFRP